MPYALCTVAAAPVRSDASHRSEMTTQLLFGEAVALLEEKEEWIRIRCRYDGYEGWVTHHLITPVAETVATSPAPYVTTGLLNELHYSDQLFQMPMGCSLPGFNETSRHLWDDRFLYKGSYRNATGAVNRRLFQTTIRPWLNAPYLWGGKTFLGVDCSGFIQTVFKVLGVPLLRDASQQVTQGEAVDFENRKEGDVAFFSNEGGRIAHVGIVLNDEKIMHASGKVRIDTLNASGIFTAAGNQTHQFHSVRRMIELKG